MIEEKVHARNTNGGELSALVLKPNYADTFPTVLFAHDLHESKEGIGNRRLYGRLVGDGFVTVAFDFSGHGSSGGKKEEVTYARFLDDLRSMLNATESMPQVDRSRIALIGRGMGAITALMLAAQDVRVKTLILISPIFHVSLRKERYPEERNVWRKKDFRDFVTGDRTVRLKSTSIDDLDDRDVIHAIRRLSCPVLLIHGAQDEKIGVRESLDLYEYLKDPKKIEIIAGSDHEISRQEDQDRVLNSIFAWLKEHLVRKGL